MSKRTLLLLLALFLILFSTVSGTLAYLNINTKQTDTMTEGKVKIRQIQQERNEYGTLQPFSQEKPLLPAVYAGDEIALAAASADWPFPDAAWQTLEENELAIDKFITVTNIGSRPAYVRTIVALECPSPGAITGGTQRFVHIHHNTDSTLFQSVQSVAGVTVNDVTYDVFIYTYKNPLEKDSTTAPSLKQLYLDKACSNAELEAIGDCYDVLALSQAVQTDGFTDAVAALDAGFGSPTKENLTQWLKEVADGTWEDDEDDENDQPDQPKPSEPQIITVSSTEQLSEALAMIPEGGSAVIQLASGTYAAPRSGLAAGKTITLQGSQGVTIQMATDKDETGASDMSYEGAVLRMENLTVQAAKSGNQQGYACASLEMNGCTIQDTMFLFAPAAFTDCSFEATAKKPCIVTNSQDVAFTGCTFQTYGTAVRITNPAGRTCTLDAAGCTLTNRAGSSIREAAFAVEDSPTTTYHYTLRFSQCTATGFSQSTQGIPTGSPLWSNRDSVSTDHLSVTMDEVAAY